MKSPLLSIACLLAFLLAAARAGEAGAAREEVFEFAQKPKVEKAGDKFVVTFASKGRCDAAVAVVDKDGRVVRHLAAGVLGANAPEPFQKGSLSQRLEWDGKDDAGKPAPAGCSVRVGLGLKADFDKFLGYDPDALVPPVIGLGCAADGTLYVYHGVWTPRITALSREGRYLRTVLPYAGAMPEEKLKGLRTTTGVGGGRLPVFESHRGNLCPWLMYSKRQVMAVSADGRIGLTGGGTKVDRARTAYNLLVVGSDGSTPTDALFGPALAELDAKSKANGIFLAAAADGKTVYASAGGSLLRAAWAGKEPAARFGPPDLTAAGVAVDAKGRVYVSDQKAGRIAVLTGDGRVERTLDFKDADALAVGPKGDAVYVLSLKAKRLVKLSAEGRELAALALPRAGCRDLGEHGDVVGTVFALDASAEPPVLWVGNPTCGDDLDILWRVVDKGGSLEPERMSARLKDPNLAHPPQFLAVNPATDEVCVRRSSGYGAGSEYPVYRYAGGTGAGGLFKLAFQSRVNYRKTFKAAELDFGPDGLLYTADGSPVEMLRADGDGKPVPFAGGSESLNTGWKFPHSTGDVGNFGWDVSPSGDIYMMKTVDKGEVVVDLYGGDGRLKKERLVTGLPRSAPGCVRADRAGNVYVGVHQDDSIVGGSPLFADILKKTGKGGPLDFARFFPADVRMSKDASVYAVDAGMVVKFGPDGGSLGGGGKGVLWAWNGFSPASLYLAGPWGCTCLNARFDLDGFDRAYVPDALACRLWVLDQAGNRILSVGRYGNPDEPAAGQKPADADVPFWFPAYCAAGDAALYVSDYAAGRVVRLKLGYRAEETLAVR